MNDEKRKKLQEYLKLEAAIGEFGAFYQTLNDPDAGQFLLMNIPDHMYHGLAVWIFFGIAPGEFLRGVLANDFCMAVLKADDMNREALRSYAIFLRNFAPAGCYGSYEKVQTWEGSL